MSWKNLKVSARLIGGLTVLTVLAVGIGGMSWYSVRSIERDLNGITEVAAPAVEATDDLFIDVLESTKIAEEVTGAYDLKELTGLEDELIRVTSAYGQASGSVIEAYRPLEVMDKAFCLGHVFISVFK